MAVKRAHGWDRNTGRHLGRVPLSWFERFDHVTHEDPSGNRPGIQHVPLGTGSQRTEISLGDDKENTDAEDARGPEPEADMGH